MGPGQGGLGLPADGGVWEGQSRAWVYPLGVQPDPTLNCVQPVAEPGSLSAEQGLSFLFTNVEKTG